MPPSRATDHAPKALSTLIADPAVTDLRARNDAIEVHRDGRTYMEEMARGTDELAQMIAALLGPGRTSGAVRLSDFSGFAALPPVAPDPVLVLHRLLAVRASPETAYDSGLLTPALTQVITSLLAERIGCLLAGPPGTRLSAVMSALTQRLPQRLRVILVEDEPRINVRTALRLRCFAPEAARSVPQSVVVLDLERPPALSQLTSPSLVGVYARSPQAALATLVAGCDGEAYDPVTTPLRVADLAPLLLWYGPHSRLEQAYELLPIAPPSGGVCRTQALLLRDPHDGTLVATGAVPRDPGLAQAWAAAGL